MHLHLRFADRPRKTRQAGAVRLAGGILLVAALAALALIPAGCGSSDGSDGSGGGETAAAATPEDLGAQVVAVYDDTMTQVVDLMEARPDAVTLTPKLEELKEQAVQKLVALGKQREALDADGRAASDAVAREGLAALSPDLYTKYTEGQSHYLTQDVELGNLIADFNVITQYADFDLLRSQEPDEAERLGL